MAYKCKTCKGKITKYNWNKSSGEYDGTGYCETCDKTVSFKKEK